jgi:hypothetical protein
MISVESSDDSFSLNITGRRETLCAVCALADTHRTQRPTASLLTTPVARPASTRRQTEKPAVRGDLHRLVPGIGRLTGEASWARRARAPCARWRAFGSGRRISGRAQDQEH